MTKKKTKKSTADDVHVRIPKDVADMVEALATRADRNLTKQVAFMLRSHPLVVSPYKADA